MRGLERVREQGGEVLFRRAPASRAPGAAYVEPTLGSGRVPNCRCSGRSCSRRLLYLVEFDRLEEAIAWHNDVPAGAFLPPCSPAT